MKIVSFGMSFVATGMTNIFSETNNDIYAEYDFDSAFLKIRIVINMLF